MAERESTAGAFAKYRPIAELGHGGMAQVFLALASGPAGFNKLVVIKQIREQLAEDPEFLTMFLDEARLAARLNHPNVVQTNEVGSDGRRYFICMEYLEGQPLNRIVNRVGRAKGFTLGMHGRVLVEALTGLHHAHELRDFDGTPLQVVHRDATPHNIFVTYAGQVKVVDFGIAKAVSSSAETRAGVLKGKVSYMAPEQAASEPVDRRADVYSIGMILWEALTGTRPFKGMPDVAVLQKLGSGSIPRPSTVNADVPALLEEICMKALARDPAARFATAREMSEALEAALDTLGEKGSVRDAGRLLESIFTTERATIQKLVEAQASSVVNSRRGTSNAPLPLLEESPTVDDAASTSRKSGARGGTASRAFSRGSSVGGATGASSLGTTPVATSTAPELPSPTTLAASTASPSVAPPSPEGNPEGSREVRSRTLGIVAAAGVALILGLALIASRPGAAPSATTAALTAQPHLILIDSTPQGATVREGEAVLGKTPMSLTLDQGAPQRKLVMLLDGYQPHTFLPTRDDTRIMVPLAPDAQGREPEPRAAPAPSSSIANPPPTGLPATRPRAPAAPAPKGTPTPSDINMAR